MSKERLEEIERYHSNKKDVMWAVRQIKLLQDENETLSSALHDARHEVRVLKNKAGNLEHDFMYYFKLANKLDHQIKRYRDAIKKAIDDLENECLWDALTKLKALGGEE